MDHSLQWDRIVDGINIPGKLTVGRFHTIQHLKISQPIGTGSSILPSVSCHQPLLLLNSVAGA